MARPRTTKSTKVAPPPSKSMLLLSGHELTARSLIGQVLYSNRKLSQAGSYHRHWLRTKSLYLLKSFHEIIQHLSRSNAKAGDVPSLLSVFISNVPCLLPDLLPSVPCLCRPLSPLCHVCCEPIDPEWLLFSACFQWLN